MEISHTLDGYWILSGWIDPEYQDAQTTMKQAKEQFIKANPEIDASKVVVVNGDFKQPTLGDLARTDECRSLTDDMIAVMTNQAKMKEILGQS
ncbi:hypothetical protein T1J70_02350 [Lactiplantibacillus plantarum]|uniref:hypothetical protein n=1 Tax=Lactiplantibacillus plantarum TaxID=1590 RepID=UPI001CFC6B02|nr:hypothetical protein [Lactiplantibacillus plantarum]WQC49592.1 hypothetical protein TUW04_11100 [Lactiplantibacillus plantarum]WQG55451.1 hypothetical protein T1J70_02350 [Lactiplantibacillus plantarum]